jgi:hypothetical protein
MVYMSHAEAAPVNFEAIRSALLEVPGGPRAGYDILEPSSVLGSWIEETGFRRPVHVPAADDAPQALGIQLPPREALGIQALAAQLGYGAEVATLDGVGQGLGPRWSMYQWLQYWRAKETFAQDAQNPKDGPAAGIKRRLSDSSIEDEADSRQVKAGCVLLNSPVVFCNTRIWSSVKRPCMCSCVRFALFPTYDECKNVSQFMCCPETGILGACGAM